MPFHFSALVVAKLNNSNKEKPKKNPILVKPFKFNLPHEILVHVFRFLEKDMIYLCANVCVSWRKAATDGQLWSEITVPNSNFYSSLNRIQFHAVLSYAGLFLRKLDLRGIGCVDVELLKTIASRNKNLTLLNMQGCSSQRNDTNLIEEAFKDILEHLTDLQYLNLGFCESSSHFTRVNTSLTNFELRYLNLSCCRFINSVTFSDFIQKFSKLQVLILDGSKIIFDEEVIAAFRNLTALKRLSVAACHKLDHDSASKIFTLEELLELKMSQTYNWGRNSIFTYKFVTSLTRLNLSFCKISDDAFINIILACPNLTELDIEDCHQLTERSFQALSSAQCAISLKVLILSFCALVNNNVIELMRNCKRLERLEIDGCSRLNKILFEEISTTSQDIVPQSLVYLNLLDLSPCIDDQVVHQFMVAMSKVRSSTNNALFVKYLLKEKPAPERSRKICQIM